MADTVVVGAGIIGLSTAYHLARAGQSVTVLDRRAVGSGASGGNAGLISLGHPPMTVAGASLRGLRWMFRPSAPLHIRPSLDPDLLRWLWSFHLHCDHDWAQHCMKVMGPLGWRSMALFNEIVSEQDIDCDFAEDGWLDVCLDHLSLDAAEEEARHLEALGFEHERVETRALLAREPAFTDDVAGAIFYPDSAHCDPGAYLRGLARACERLGVTLRIGDTIEGFITEGSKVRGVRLTGGDRLEADTTVLAAGIWSTSLARQLGLSIPMQPARGYHVELEGVHTLPSTGCVLNETFIAATPMRDRLRLAGTLEIAPLGRPWSRRRLEMLRRGAARYIRGIDRALVTEEWAGYRPCTPDGLPAMGEARPGLFVATGHAMQGLTLGPASGELVADLILDGSPRIDPDLVSPTRFA